MMPFKKTAVMGARTYRHKDLTFKAKDLSFKDLTIKARFDLRRGVAQATAYYM